MSYVEQWCIQWGKERSDLIDEKFARLCSARLVAANKPIYYQVWDWDNPDDLIRRYIPYNEPCQCCETRLAQMNGGHLVKYNRSGEYRLTNSKNAL